jgi:hypothetical protein
MKNVFLVLICAMALSACLKKEPDCHEESIPSPDFIAFYGFNPQDLDTLIVTKFAANDSFTQKIETDTLVNLYVVNKGGELFADSSGLYFTTVDNEADLQIYVPATGSQYLIHAVYDSLRNNYFPCNSSVTEFPQAPAQLIVNGNVVPDTSKGPYNGYFFLHP